MRSISKQSESMKDLQKEWPGEMILIGLVLWFSCLVCVVKSQIGLDDIKNNIDSLLKSLGHVRKILDDTIGVKISNFLLDVKKINDASIQNHLNDILSRM